LLSDLLGHFRNLLVYKVSRGDLNLLEVSETEAASLQAQAATVEIEPLTRMMEVLTDAEGRLSGAASKKIFVEVTMLKAIQARHAVSIDALLEQLTSLKGDSGAASSGSKSTAPVSAPPSKPTPPAVSRTVSATAATAEALPMAPVMPLAPVATAAPSPPPAVSVPAPVVSVSETGTFNLADLWVQLVEAIGRASPFMRSYFLEAHPVSLARHVLTIGFDPEFADHIGLVDNQRTHALVQTKLQELGHAQTQVKFIQAEAPERPHRPETGPAVPEAAPSVPAATAPAVASAAVPPASGAVRPPVVARAKSAPLTLSAEEFKNDPLIKAALEIFKGQIVEIRA
jgi:DNA polymerase III gamma/tau subunit